MQIHLKPFHILFALHDKYDISYCEQISFTLSHLHSYILTTVYSAVFISDMMNWYNCLTGNNSKQLFHAIYCERLSGDLIFLEYACKKLYLCILSTCSLIKTVEFIMLREHCNVINREYLIFNN